MNSDQRTFVCLGLSNYYLVRKSRVSIPRAICHNMRAMAGRRPHLVHEGSSILDENDHPLHDADGFSSTSSQLLIHDHDDNSTREKQQHLMTVGGSSLHRAVGGSKVITTSHKTKLQTKFIVGHAASSLKLLDFDESMMSLPGEDNEIDPPPEKSLRPMTADEAVFPTRTNNYKLRTRLVVGVNQCDDDLDENMIMDEDGAGEQQQLIIQFNKVRCSSNNPIHHESISSIIPTIPMHNQPSSSISPLVILDGANIAYNYYDCVNPSLHSHSSQRRQPDSRGIRFAIDYFLLHNCRVQAVVPVSWYQLKPRPADQYHLHNRSRGDSDARMVTEEVEELRLLRQRGLLVSIPPGDDDDAYALALARREDERLLEQKHHHQQQRRQHEDDGMMLEDENMQHFLLPLGGYVVSNDMFHDAIRRDENKLRHHELSLNMRSSMSLKGWLMKKRISYSFANVGTAATTTQGDIQLDFVPNPRSDLIEAIDEYNRLKSGLRWHR